MEDFINTLTPKQRQALLTALTETKSVDIKQQPEPTEEDFINKNDPFATNNVADDFTIIKENNLQSNSRRVPVQAKQNAWTDTGEHKNIETPQVTKTPRNRKPATKITAKCHVCGKLVEVDKRFQYGEFVRCDNCGTKR